jgi:hypothetical protein
LATEKFANKAFTTLNGAIDSDDTPIVVTSATLFPTTGNFRIKIDAELLLVTAVSGSNFTVTRGIEGSTAVSHADGATITHVVTAGAIEAQTSDTLPLSECGGRLTLTTAVPVTTSDVTAAATLYFTPYKGNRIALYNGAIWKLYGASEVSFTLTSLTSDKNYDVFLYDNSGTLTIELSAAWSTDTARTDALALQDGVLVKSGSLTRRYLGTIRTTSTSTTEDSIAKRFVWNYYNPVKRRMLVIESTSSWAYTTQAFRQVRATASNKFEYVSGQPDTLVSARSYVIYYSTTSTVTCMGGVGIDSTTVSSAQVFGGNNGAANIAQQDTAEYQGYPGLGYHAINWLEYGSTDVNFIGTFAVTQYQSGMHGEIVG